MKKVKCSPSVQKTDGTCYSNESLTRLKELWNQRHPDVKITTNDEREIWNALKRYMDDVCDNEKCWLEQEFSKNQLTQELLHYTFIPDAPHEWSDNPTTWLNSLDIERVMKQYEKKHPHFQFIGPSPIDFDKRLHYNECVWDDLCNFNVHNMYKKGKTHTGFIFNLDPHYKSGSHWVSMYLNMNEGYIFFFDSTGENVPSEIKNFMNRITTQCSNIDVDLEHIVNKKEHQKSNTECGMYSLHMIIAILDERKHPKHFSEKHISDAKMKKLRKELFHHK